MKIYNALKYFLKLVVILDIIIKINFCLTYQIIELHIACIAKLRFYKIKVNLNSF